MVSSAVQNTACAQNDTWEKQKMGSLHRSAGSAAQIEAAEAYEKLFVPALFGEWAPRVCAAAAVGPGDRVLDVACGTGVAAREALARVGANGSVTALDANAGMLDVAVRLGGAIDYRQGTAESLPFADGSFDAVLCQFGLMFFSDRSAALREVRRVLAPSGRFAFAVWNQLETAPAFATLAAVLDEVAGPRAANALHAPFALGERRGLLELFATAGLPPVALVTQRGNARFPSARLLIEAELRGWLPVMGIELDEAQMQRVLEAAESRLEPWVEPGGQLVSAMSAHIVTAQAAR
jgi:SAM-dependent methyltransferase